MHHLHKPHIHHVRERCKVAFNIERQFVAVERGVDRQIAQRAHEQRVAVGRGFGREFGADHTLRTGAVVDHYLSAQRFAELGRNHARHDVGAAAGREGDDDADRLGRKRLRV